MRRVTLARIRAVHVGAGLVTAGLFLAGALLALLGIAPDLFRPTAEGGPYDARRLVLLYSTLPRMLTALLAGAALSLSGALLQRALRNPLASPSTLGISAGASLALAVTMLAFPALQGLGRDTIALAGGAAAALVVFAIGARRGFSPLSLVLAGLMVGLWCAALSAILVLLNDRYLTGLFIWGAGSLSMQSWNVPLALLPKLAVVAVLAYLLARPLTLMELGDAGAAALGLPVARLRVLAVVLAVALVALVTSAVGVIGFVGLVAPAVARLAGARDARAQMVWSPLIGAALLLLTDEAVKLLSGSVGAFIPTGAMTALTGAPLVLLLLTRLRAAHRPPPSPSLHIEENGRCRVGILLIAILAFALLSGLALFLGRAPHGAFELLPLDEWRDILPYRWPRVTAAFAAGLLLGAAGTVLQRLTGNEIASPEVLGVSAGASLGMAAALFVFTAAGPALRLALAATGAFVALMAILAAGSRTRASPERVLLTGVVLTAMLDALSGVLAAGGDPRAMLLVRWMAGSTHLADGVTAVTAALSAAVLVSAGVTAHRWLTLLPLGEGTARQLGVPVCAARAALFALAAAMTAAATLVAGPLSFAGLMGPHLARELGFRRAGPQLAAAALAGGLLLTIADYAGRMVAFPYQLPAGLVSAVAGAPLLMVLLAKRR